MSTIRVEGRKYKVFEINTSTQLQKYSVMFRKNIPSWCDNCTKTKYGEWHKWWEDIPAVRQFKIPVPINLKSYIKISVKRCDRCHALFSEDVKTLEWARTIAPDYLEVANEESAYYKIELDYPQRIPSSKTNSIVCGIALIIGNKYSLYWITERIEDQKPEYQIYHFTHDIARKMIAGVCRNSSTIEFLGQQRSVYLFMERKDRKTTLVYERSTLIIEKGNNGGYYTTNPTIIPYIGLLSCKGSDYAGILKVSLDTKTGYFYADTQQFRQFVNWYGQPLTHTIGMDEDQLSMEPESILHARGYNVNKKNNLSAAARQKILSDVIEENVLEVTEILSFLSSMINLHGERFPNAGAKYREDYIYVSNYKSSSNHVLIFK